MGVVRGDCRTVLRDFPEGIFRACVTSPPYWSQRVYLPEGHPDAHLEIGREVTPEAYIAEIVSVFREVRRVLAPDGTLWVNIGDKYANDKKWGGRTGGKHARKLHGSSGVGRAKVVTGLPPKSLIGLPWLLAFALQKDGWTIRSDVIWHKTNACPEGGVVDRPYRAHEHVLICAKSERYFFNRSAAPTDVWQVPTEPGDGTHIAPMPLALARRCILAGSAVGDSVLDPFGGSGTVGRVAAEEGRNATLIDLDDRAVQLALERMAQGNLPFNGCNRVG